MCGWGQLDRAMLGQPGWPNLANQVGRARPAGLSGWGLARLERLTGPTDPGRLVSGQTLAQSGSAAFCVLLKAAVFWLIWVCSVLRNLGRCYFAQLEISGMLRNRGRWYFGQSAFAAFCAQVRAVAFCPIGVCGILPNRGRWYFAQSGSAAFCLIEGGGNLPNRGS